jgi:hypothetical protein
MLRNTSALASFIGFLCFTSLPGPLHYIRFEALKRDRVKGHADALFYRSVPMAAPPHHPVDALLPQSRLQRMKRLLESKDGCRRERR